MPGPVALVGAGEFLPAFEAFDLDLLAATGRDRPRVVLLPTASYPDGEDVFMRAAEMGVAHFSAIGAEVEPVLVRDRSSADDGAASQAIGEADLVYLSSGRSAHLIAALTGTGVGRALAAAHARGAVLAGCAAGASALAATSFAPRLRVLPWPLRWCPGLGFVHGAAVVPDYGAVPEPLAALIALQAPRHHVLLGLDGGSAAVGRDGAWQVYGTGRVTLWRGRHRQRYRAGDAFRL